MAEAWQNIMTINLNLSSGISSKNNETMEDIIEEYRQGLYTFRETHNIILVLLYSLVFLTAAVANALVIVVVLRYRHLRSVTNYFLVNLSVADLLVTLVCMPMAVSCAVIRTWLFGIFMCKFTSFLQGVAVSASVFSIAAMSVDRYLAIRHPMIFRQVFNKILARCVVLGIWIVAAVFFAPLLWVRQIEGITFVPIGGTYLFCVERWPTSWDRKAYDIFLFLAVYAVPSLVILAAYISMGCKLCSQNVVTQDGGNVVLDRESTPLRGRRRVARTLVILAFVFALCWLPYNFVNLALESQIFEPHHLPVITSHVLPFTLLLGHANSAVNPILYCFFSRNFRQCVLNLIHWKRYRSNSATCNQANRNRRQGNAQWRGQAVAQRIPALQFQRENLEEEEETPMSNPRLPEALAPSSSEV